MLGIQVQILFLFLSIYIYLSHIWSLFKVIYKFLILNYLYILFIL